MNGHGKSDDSAVPMKLPNKGGGTSPSTEGAEGRESAKGNPVQQNRVLTQWRVTLQHALERIRQAVNACALDLRQEPSGVILQAGICAGGAG